MRITVAFMGPIERIWDEDERQIEVPDGIKVNALLAHLGYEELKARTISVLRDGRRLRPFERLDPACRVVLMVPAGGG